jgi:tripartite-type tricarboxylate transporter receptor subunit TctC
MRNHGMTGRLSRRGLVLAAACLLSGAALAQDYPSRPVKLIVPFPPGGSVDTVARIIAPRLGEKLGQSIVIENRGGAGGMVGTAEAARAAPDGYTILMVFDTHATNHHLNRNISFDTFTALRPVTLMATAPMILSASTKSGIRSLDELIARAKAQPGTISYAHPGPGSSNQLAALQLQDLAGIRLNEIAYRGAGPMVSDLVGGHVDIAFTTISSAIGQIRTGNMTGVALGSRERLALLAAPTVGERFPGFTANAWIGMLTPAGVPDAIVERLHKATTETLEEPAVRQRLEEQGFVIEASTPAAFGAFIRQESERWGAVIQKHGIGGAN